MNNRLRVLIATALASHQLVSDDATTRLNAVRQLQGDSSAEQLPLLVQRRGRKDAQVHDALNIAIATRQLIDADPLVRLDAVKRLGQTGDPQMQALLQPLTQAPNESDTGVRAAAQESLDQIKQSLIVGDLLGQAFTGLSLGSILLLAALGLAITYGLLGVINMAHGEMLMLGAYATWLVQSLCQQFAPVGWRITRCWRCLSLFITAGVGMALERTVIRHLYGRPLETLLATWGLA